MTTTGNRAAAESPRVADRVERVAAALRSHNIEAIVVDTGQARMGVDTALEKVLIIFGEWQAGRTTVVLVREPVGI
jgi:hypothetical protein